MIAALFALDGERRRSVQPYGRTTPPTVRGAPEPRNPARLAEIGTQA
jgi:hypothetical protein